MTTLTETAHHEAGHAVLTLRCGRRLESVWIEANGGNSRQYDPLWHKADANGLIKIKGDDRFVAVAGLLIILAGPYAQRKFTGSPHTPMAGSDKQDIDSFFAHMQCSDSEVKRLTRLAKANTKRLVDFYWCDIEAVAAALLERCKLSGAEVERLLDPAKEGVTIEGVRLCGTSLDPGDIVVTKPVLSSANVR
jgi:hypothetical protein